MGEMAETDGMVTGFGGLTWQVQMVPMKER